MNKISLTKRATEFYEEKGAGNNGKRGCNGFLQTGCLMRCNITWLKEFISVRDVFLKIIYQKKSRSPKK